MIQKYATFFKYVLYLSVFFVPKRSQLSYLNNDWFYVYLDLVYEHFHYCEMSSCTFWRAQELNRLNKKRSTRKKPYCFLTWLQIDISVIFLQEVFRAGSFLNVILNWSREEGGKTRNWNVNSGLQVAQLWLYAHNRYYHIYLALSHLQTLQPKVPVEWYWSLGPGVKGSSDELGVVAVVSTSCMSSISASPTIK